MKHYPPFPVPSKDLKIATERNRNSMSRQKVFSIDI